MLKLLVLDCDILHLICEYDDARTVEHKLLS
jgi:hypothetical protein